MATAVKMYIEKFGKEVMIEEDHPLAVAQRAKDAEKPKASADKPKTEKGEQRAKDAEK